MPLTVGIFKTYINNLSEELNAKIDRLDSRMTNLAKECYVPLCSATTEEELQKSLDSITVSKVILFVL